MLQSPSLSLPAPPPPLCGATSFPPLCEKMTFQSSVHWGTCAAQTCTTWGTGSKVGYSPPGPQLCHAHGGVQGEPRGWSDLKPHPGTPLPGNGAATDV